VVPPQFQRVIYPLSRFRYGNSKLQFRYPIRVTSEIRYSILSGAVQEYSHKSIQLFSTY